MADEDLNILCATLFNSAAIMEVFLNSQQVLGHFINWF
jgi:hypothetical protein